MKRVRVLIVEDSTVVRELLRHLVARDPRLEVAAAVATAEEALDLLPRLAPDVISMDIRLPGMDGLEATRRIMSDRPTPVVVIASSIYSADLQIAMNALRAGALTVLEKPVGETHPDYEAVAGRLCTQLAIMSQVPVVRQRGARAPAREPRPAAPPAAARRSFQAVGLAASTGGPAALAKVLGALPRDFPLPVLVVQHMTPQFMGGFAEWLGSVISLPVALAAHGEPPAPGRVYVAPAERHLLLGPGRLELGAGPSVSGQRPSGTVLFESMARVLGPGGLGVLLTGMGDDGARGLLALRQGGGYTLAEARSTAVVYGMPMEAVRLGGACESVPLPDVAGRILDLVGVPS